MLRSSVNNVFNSQLKNVFFVLLPTNLTTSTTYLAVDDFNNSRFAIANVTRFSTGYRNASNTTSVVRTVDPSAQFTLTPAIVACQIEGQLSNTVDEVQILINNLLGLAATTGNGVYAGPYTAARTILGAINISGAFNLVGFMGEVLYYDGQLDGGQIESVRQYLSAKWSIAL
jgi:hypothetical protein